MKNFLFIALVSVFLVSCGKIDLYEKQAQIPEQQWFYNYVPEFTFHIDDTSSLYNVYIVLRHTDLYNYNNIWLNIGSRPPGDSMHFQKVNLTLASDSKGWEGRGTGDIFEVRKSISPGPVSFKTSGDYTFSIAQIMRENPLRYILNVGIRLEKVEM